MTPLDRTVYLYPVGNPKQSEGEKMATKPASGKSKPQCGGQTKKPKAGGGCGCGGRKATKKA